MRLLIIIDLFLGIFWLREEKVVAWDVFGVRLSFFIDFFLLFHALELLDILLQGVEIPWFSLGVVLEYFREDLVPFEFYPLVSGLQYNGDVFVLVWIVFDVKEFLLYFLERLLGFLGGRLGKKIPFNPAEFFHLEKFDFLASFFIL